jgi:acyl carrier protein
MKLYKKKNTKLIKLEDIFFEIKKKKYKKNISIAEALDSIEILEFIVKIEKKFKIKIDPKKINEKNFKSLETILQFILNKK